MHPTLPAGNPRTATVFAHPAHEWFTLASVLRYQPEIYYLSRGAFGAPHFEGAFRAALAEVGFQGTVTFANEREEEVYQRLLRRDESWSHHCCGELREWLSAVRPQVVFVDAFEWYNSAHDLVPLLVTAALRSQEWRQPLPEIWEHGVGVHTIPPAQQQASGWPAITLDASELAAKMRLLETMDRLIESCGAQANDALTNVTAAWSGKQFRTEWYRRTSLSVDYTTPPLTHGWQTYDERGVRRVLAGRSRQAISFAEHFAPLAAALLGARSAHRAA